MLRSSHNRLPLFVVGEYYQLRNNPIKIVQCSRHKLATDNGVIECTPNGLTVPPEFLNYMV